MELTRVHHREEPIILLYEAAISGSTTTLESLIHKDKLILNKVSLSSFTETPLHISALHGHLDFTIAILEKCPKMALGQDSLKRLPLHLAAAEGHTQIVKALLNQDKSSCLARDGEGRTALHWAVIRGTVEVIQELVAANSEFILEDLHGETVFHLCVKYNRLEVLRLLVELINDYKIINMGNQDGNSVLHLAAMLKQFDTLRYLLSIPEIKAQKNSRNKKGLTALDLLDECPEDSKTIQIQDFLIKEGLTKAKKKWFQKVSELFEYDIDEIRGALMIVATVIATMSYQAAINPPGGVWQQDFKNETESSVCSNSTKCHAGASVLASSNAVIYQVYMIFTSLAFASSICVIALMVGGFPLKNKYLVWFLALTINGTVLFLSISYVSGVWFVSRSSSLIEGIGPAISIISGILGCGFLVLIIIYLVQLVIWTVNKVHKVWRRIKNKSVCYMNHDEGAQNLA